MHSSAMAFGVLEDTEKPFRRRIGIELARVTADTIHFSCSSFTRYCVFSYLLDSHKMNYLVVAPSFSTTRTARVVLAWMAA